MGGSTGEFNSTSQKEVIGSGSPSIGGIILMLMGDHGATGRTSLMLPPGGQGASLLALILISQGASSLMLPPGGQCSPGAILPMGATGDQRASGFRVVRVDSEDSDDSLDSEDSVPDKL